MCFQFAFKLSEMKRDDVVVRTHLRADRRMGNTPCQIVGLAVFDLTHVGEMGPRYAQSPSRTVVSVIPARFFLLVACLKVLVQQPAVPPQLPFWGDVSPCSTCAAWRFCSGRHGSQRMTTDAARPPPEGGLRQVHLALAYQIPTSSSIMSLTSSRFTRTG